MSEGITVKITKDTDIKFPGLRHEHFNIFVNTDLLRPGSKIYPADSYRDIIIIQTIGSPYGKGWEYRAAYVTDNPESYFPPGKLKKGVEFRYAGSDFPSLRPWEMWVLNELK